MTDRRIGIGRPTGYIGRPELQAGLNPQRLEEWRKATIDEQRAWHHERERLTKMVQWLIRAKAALAVKEQAGEDTTELAEAIIRVEAEREALRWHLL